MVAEWRCMYCTAFSSTFTLSIIPEKYSATARTHSFLSKSGCHFISLRCACRSCQAGTARDVGKTSSSFWNDSMALSSGSTSAAFHFTVGEPGHLAWGTVE